MIRVDWADDPFVWVTFVRSLRVWGHAVQVMKGELSLWLCRDHRLGRWRQAATLVDGLPAIRTPATAHISDTGPKHAYRNVMSPQLEYVRHEIPSITVGKW